LATTIGKTVYSLYNNGKQRCYAAQQSKYFLRGLIQGYITKTGCPITRLNRREMQGEQVQDFVVQFWLDERHTLRTGYKNIVAQYPEAK
jgi:hypothetical protein